tara:strand:- start:203372 stop:206089 length:2718 start_codon:yes stop_codon:yes gene_type:complete
MNTLINRLFTRDEPNYACSPLAQGARLDLLQYLCNKGTTSNKLRKKSATINSLTFSDNDFIANLQLIQQYLEIENYLVYHDSRYIGSEIILRREVQTKFPKVVNMNVFKPLFTASKTQEIYLGIQFLEYVLHIFISENNSLLVAKRLQNSLNEIYENKQVTRLIDQINQLRSLKEQSNEIYDQLSKTTDRDLVDTIYLRSYNEFTTYYSILKKSKTIENLLPEHILLNGAETDNSIINVKSPTATIKTDNRVKIDDLSILDNILDAFLLFNREGTILKHNSKAIKIFGAQPHELENNSIYNLLPEHIVIDLRHDLENRNPVIANKIIGSRREIEVNDLSEHNKDFEITITNNYSNDMDTFSMFIKNISNKKETLKAISDAKIEAERMAKAKSTFLSNMSHEIRTPLNVILGLSEIILKGDIKNHSLLKTNLEGIDFSARNLLAIVNDILDFSKIEAGKLSIQAIDFNLHKVVTSLTNGFAIKAKEKGLVLETHIDTEIPDIVIGDQYRLNQILTNLIGNSIKFTQKGKVSVTVKLVSEADNEIALKFQVKDTGIGIEKEKLSHIFDSFYQVEDPNNSKIIGTGLGLAITKELIELQNGILHAESLVGMGSIFEFILPLKKSKLKKITDLCENRKLKTKNLNGLKVLVAEDNKMNQFYIKQLLDGMEVDVDIAENGAIAVEKFNNAEVAYDLILMDMHMPVMNGIEAINIIRKSNKNSLKKVPIVACSADVFPEARKNAIKAGIDFYLTKPLNEDSIKEVLFWLISDNEFEPELAIINADSDRNENSPRSSNVDINKLKVTFDNDYEFISSLLEIFIKETPEEYKSLRHCIDHEFYTRASSLAHKMKSSFMNLGMTQHGHHLQQIETGILRKETLEDAKKHMEAFSKIYNKILLEVNLLLIELRQY